MIPAALLPTTATWLVASATTDMYGNTQPSWSTGTPIACRVDQQARSETDDETRDAVAGRWLLLTNELGIGGRDRVVVGTVTYEVDGQPWVVTDFSGAHHLEATLQAVAG